MNVQPANALRVIVGLSGGVDSSVSALLLQREGYEVEGLFMKNWEEDDDTEYCTAKQDLADAEAVANHLSIHYTELILQQSIGTTSLNTFYLNTKQEEHQTPTFCVTAKSNSKYSSITQNYSAQT